LRRRSSWCLTRDAFGVTAQKSSGRRNATLAVEGRRGVETTIHERDGHFAEINAPVHFGGR
jgi:hypothetical protein